ncbi:hypothetical protein [Planctomicrobium sp. SH527]|uniref:hypothetical protein n=1 Tax=Planctomicrobium sp. SH527 TaxID=3448123 RepID=UPI003F5BD966
MQEYQIELRVGETLQLGQYAVTVVDIDGDNFCFLIDGGDDHGEFSGVPEENLEFAGAV